MPTSSKIRPALWLLTCSAATGSVPAQADGAGAFIGGVMAARVMSNMERRTQAEEEQAYYSSRPQPVVQQPAPAPAPAQTAEQRIQQLDRLAAGGYITPEEYKAKKQAIIDGR